MTELLTSEPVKPKNQGAADAQQSEDAAVVLAQEPMSLGAQPEQEVVVAGQ